MTWHMIKLLVDRVLVLLRLNFLDNSVAFVPRLALHMLQLVS